MDHLTVSSDMSFWLFSVILPLTVSVAANFLTYFLLAALRRFNPQFLRKLKIAAHARLQRNLSNNSFLAKLSSVPREELFVLLRVLVGIISGTIFGISAAWLSQAEATLLARMSWALFFGGIFGFLLGFFLGGDFLTTSAVMITLLALPGEDPIDKLNVTLFLTPLISSFVIVFKTRYLKEQT